VQPLHRHKEPVQIQLYDKPFHKMKIAYLIPTILIFRYE
jgi:hypothetical protein